MADDQDEHLKPLSGLDSRVVVLIVLVSKVAVSGLSVLGSKFVTALYTSTAIWLMHLHQAINYIHLK